MAECYSDDQLILAARLYYLEGLSQPEIARLVHGSQSRVSRMLALARERGLVTITVPEYEPRNTALERRLAERFPLRRVAVIRTAASQPIAAIRATVGWFGAPVLAQWLAPASRVAIAGGRTLQSLIERIPPPAALRALTVMQAMGNIDSSPGCYDALELGRELARRWGGAFMMLNAPAILPDVETCRRLTGLDQIGEVLTRLARADVALVGVGTLENSVFVERKVLPPRDVAALREAGAVGEILGRFFNAAGRQCDSPLRDRVISLDLDRLRRIPETIAIVSGADRAPALRAAIAGGLIKSLLIDEGGANSMLEES